MRRNAYSINHLHKCVSKNESIVKLATWNIFTRQEFHYAKHLFSLTGVQLFIYLYIPVSSCLIMNAAITGYQLCSSLACLLVISGSCLDHIPVAVSVFYGHQWFSMIPSDCCILQALPR